MTWRNSPTYKIAINALAGIAPGGVPRGVAGFTLIEMVVVLVVLGLVAGLVVARGPSRSASLDLRAASETVASALRLGRSQAIATNQPVTVTLDAARHTLRVGRATPRPLPPDIELVGRPAGIRFAPDGSASGGSFVLAAGPRRAEIAVSWLTGRVSSKMRQPAAGEQAGVD